VGIAGRNIRMKAQRKASGIGAKASKLKVFDDFQRIDDSPMRNI